MNGIDSPASGLIAGRYRILAQLGGGGMGSVWRAEDLTLGSPVAIKLIDPSLVADESIRARFYQEARAAAALRSPHVVQVLDYGVDQGVPFIAMEVLDGESLSDRLARIRVLPPNDLLRVFTEVSRAIRKAHEAEIVHRDLKPDNIFLVRNDDQELAKVLDFGIAKTAPTTGAQAPGTNTGTLLGTLPYMSPEQARGAAVDWRTDLWSLGAIAFECLCGHPPFMADAAGELILQICAMPLPVPSRLARVPQGFDLWFARAMDRDPAARFQSANEMAAALRVALTTSEVPARDLTQLGLGPAPVEPVTPLPAPRPPAQVLVPVPQTAAFPLVARSGTLDGGSTVESVVGGASASAKSRSLGTLLGAFAVVAAVVTTGAWALRYGTVSSPLSPPASAGQVDPVGVPSPEAAVSVVPAVALDSPTPGSADPAATPSAAPDASSAKPKSRTVPAALQAKTKSPNPTPATPATTPKPKPKGTSAPNGSTSKDGDRIGF